MANILEYRCFAMVRNFVYLVIFLGILMKQRIPAFQLVTENDYVLVGHVFRQFYARDWFNCIQACQDEPRCISYNYERSAVANGLCELNNCGVEGLGDKDKSLFVSKGFVFQQIRESKASTIICRPCVVIRHWSQASVSLCSLKIWLLVCSMLRLRVQYGDDDRARLSEHYFLEHSLCEARVLIG